MLASRCWQNWYVSGKCQLCRWISVSGAQSKKPFLWLFWREHAVRARWSSKWRKYEEMASFEDLGPSVSFSRWVRFSDGISCTFRNALTWFLKINSYYQVFCPCMWKSFCYRLLEEKNYRFFQEVFSRPFQTVMLLNEIYGLHRAVLMAIQATRNSRTRVFLPLSITIFDCLWLDMSTAFVLKGLFSYVLFWGQIGQRCLGAALSLGIIK